MKWTTDVLRPLERFEGLLADVYMAFSDRFEKDAKASQLFAGLARASKTRKSQIDFLNRLAKSIEKSLAEPKVDVGRITRECDALERIKGMLEHVNLELAVVQSLQLECGGSKFISHNAIGEAHPDLAQMIRGFGPRRDAANPGLLVAFATERGIPLPPPVAAAAQAAIAAASVYSAQASELAEAAKKAAEADAAKRAAEERELEAAVKAGKNAIDYRLTKKKV